MKKELIRPDRKRKIPPRFSWIDHRLVQHQYFKKTSPGAMKLYLFLLTVGDVDGLSFYGLRSLADALSMDESEIRKFRKELNEAGLTAYSKPFYQVLDLSIPTETERNSFRACLKEAVKRNEQNVIAEPPVALQGNPALGRLIAYKPEALKDVLNRLTRGEA
jgi:hypothetical protein